MTLRLASLAQGKAGGIVLAGGKSTRMGVPKATLPFGPETMLQRVVRLLAIGGSMPPRRGARMAPTNYRGF